MYVNTVDPSYKISNPFNAKIHSMPTCTGNVNTIFTTFQKFKWIENPLNIKEVISQNVQTMLTLLIQAKNPNSHQMHCVLILSIKSNYNVNSSTKCLNFMKL